MSVRYIITILLAIAFWSCNNNPDPNKGINLIENPNIKLRDTAFEQYHKGNLFSPHIVRIDNNKQAAYMKIDSIYFNVKSLDKNTRADYYKKTIALQSKDELEAHRRVWGIKEVRAMQQSDGGPGTIVSWTKDILDAKSGYYLIELKRNDVEEMSQVYGISVFRVRLHPASMEIGDESGYFVSLEAWRRTQK